MKLLFLILTVMAALFVCDAYALQSRKIVSSVSAPIPTSYSYTDRNSLAWSEISEHKHLAIQNTSSSAIACLPNGGNTTQPSQLNTALTTVSEEVFLPATTQLVFDGLQAGDHVYCRSDSGAAITSGQIILHVW